MNYRNQYAWAVICLGLAICFLIFTLFLFVDGKIDSDPIKFKFSLDGSQDALTPLVGQNL